MKPWQKNLGTSFSALGTALMGIGVVPQLSGSSSKLLTGIAMAGFIFSAAGTFFSHLFVSDLSSQSNTNTAAIAAQPQQKV